MRDFDEERKVDEVRAFKLDGHEFHFRNAIDQDKIDAYFDSLGSDVTNAVVMETMDEVVLACLLPEDHEAWRKARHQTETPVMAHTIHDIISHMIGVMTKRPTERRTDSTGTPDSTSTSSTEKSPQPVEVH